MDPDAALAKFIDAAVGGNVHHLSEAYLDLFTWLSSGGFTPAEPRQAEPDRVVQALRAMANVIAATARTADAVSETTVRDMLRAVDAATPSTEGSHP